MHWDYGMGMGFGMGWFWILFLVVIVLLVVNLAAKKEQNPQSKSAIEILKERYAKGEIDKEEFDQKRKDLAES